MYKLIDCTNLDYIHDSGHYSYTILYNTQDMLTIDICTNKLLIFANNDLQITYWRYLYRIIREYY